MIVFNDMTIYLTEECNFACSYCYFNKNNRSTLDFRTISRWIDSFYNKVISNTKVCSITILGGEPLLKKDLLFKTIDYIRSVERKSSINTKILIFTNGSLLDRKTASLLLEKKVGIYLSLDGIKESHDSYRMFRDKEKGSSFDKIMDNLDSMPKTYLEKMHVNMVIGPKNCKHLMDNVRFLHELGFNSVDISLMSYALWPKESIQILVSQLDILFEYYRSIFIDGKKKPFKMYQLEELFNKGWNKMDRCNRIKLGPDGKLYFCDAFFSIRSDLRIKYALTAWDRKFIENKTSEIKAEARKGLQDIFPRTFKLHQLNKFIYCPYGVYYDCKEHNKDLMKSLRNYYLFSRIYSSFLIHLFKALKDNKRFLDYYGRVPKDKQYYSSCKSNASSPKCLSR